MATSKATSPSIGQRAELRAILVVIAVALAGLGISSGAGGATWPDVLDSFGVSDGWFGLLNGLGILISLPLLVFGGKVINRAGKIPLLMASAAGFIIFAAGFVYAPRAFLVFAFLMIIRGLSYATIDLSANALAMDAERVAKKHIMSPLHAGYSAGTILGAGMAALLFSAGSSFKTVYLIVAAIFIAIFLAPALVGFRDKLAAPSTSAEESTVSLAGFKDSTIRVAAIMAGLSFGGEVLIAEWIAIYLRDERGFSSSTGRVGRDLVRRGADDRSIDQWSLRQPPWPETQFPVAGGADHPRRRAGDRGGTRHRGADRCVYRRLWPRGRGTQWAQPGGQGDALGPWRSSRTHLARRVHRTCGGATAGRVVRVGRVHSHHARVCGRRRTRHPDRVIRGTRRRSIVFPLVFERGV